MFQLAYSHKIKQLPNGFRNTISIEDKGKFAVEAKLIADSKNTYHVTLNTTHVFTRTGTYFLTLNVASQR